MQCMFLPQLQSRGWFFVLTSLWLGLSGCFGQSARNAKLFDPGYRFDQPDQVFVMPDTLYEISGLGGQPNGSLLAAIQDEAGVVFLLDKSTGALVRSFAFWKNGDYEGIEWVGNSLYVVKNSGTIYQMDCPAPTDTLGAVEKYNTWLSSDHDVEGLAYDAANNQLLLACKSSPGDPLVRNIYGFSLTTHTLAENPVAQLHKMAVETYLRENPTHPEADKLHRWLEPGSDSFEFSPSGLAIHPLTGHWYLTSAVGNWLLVMQPHDGRVLHVAKLRKSVHPQPEGIWFASDATLYISNEGAGEGPGLINRYHYQLSE